MTKTDAGLWSRIAAETWAENFSDALACFSSDCVNKALYGFFATTKRADEEIGYGDICRAFLDLVDRNVLVPEFRSDLADEQMQAMRARFGPEQTVAAGGAPQATSLTPAQRENALVEECAADYKLLDTQNFKRKWMVLPSRRAVYEQAITAGRI